MDTKVYGPVVLSEDLVRLLAYVDSANPYDVPDGPTLADAVKFLNQHDLEKVNALEFNLTQETYDQLVEDLYFIHGQYSDHYPCDTLMELNGSGLRTEMRADEIQIGHKFQLDGPEGNGGKGVRKQWKRLENPFGPDVVDGQIAARVCHAYDGTEGKTVKLPADLIVRPCRGGEVADNHIIGIFRTPEEIKASQDKRVLERKAMDSIQDRVKEYIEAHSDKSPLVYYSAYPSEDGVAQDNLDQVAIPGKAILIAEADDFFGGDESHTYESEVVENITWLELCVLCNDMIHTTRDQHHIFLEGVYKTKKKPVDGVPVYEFAMGS